MSTLAERRAEDSYEAQNDATTGNVPSGDIKDNTYSGRKGGSGNIPVQSDDAQVEDPVRAPESNSDAQLGETAPQEATIPLRAEFRG
jgi:hypothetical protein